jgi:hypothetical protein
MKNILLATAVFFGAASAASAFEIGNTGLNVGGEVESTYNFGTEDFGVLFTPEASFEYSGLALSVTTDFDLLNIDEDLAENFDGLDFEAIYGLNDFVEVFGEISTDEDFEFGDLVVGSRLSF